VNHADHVTLIQPGIERNRSGAWADFGAGSGALTLALRDIAGPDAEIIAIDRDLIGLQTLRASMERHFPGTRLHLLQADIAARLRLPPLDGIIAANAIHYTPTRHHVALLQRWKEYLQPEGRLIVVEYDTDSGNRWVPYPMSSTAFQESAQAAGFTAPLLLGMRPSRWLAPIYAALTFPISATSPVET
jgi:trans-aconitate methyltransferase